MFGKLWQSFLSMFRKNEELSQWKRIPDEISDEYEFACDEHPWFPTRPNQPSPRIKTIHKTNCNCQISLSELNESLKNCDETLK